MKLSVIVPVYNAGPYLDACVRSLLDQDFRDLELILVDDGSRDDSLARCRRWAGQDARVRVLHQENRGQAAARNAGLDAAKGEWISFVDADDTLGQGCYTHAFAAAAGRQADVISFGFTYVGADGTPRGTATAPDFYAPDKAAFQPYFPEYRVNCFSSPCKLYRKALLDAHGIRFPADLRAGEDTFFNFDVFTWAQGIVHVRTPYYAYWQHANASVTRHGQADLWARAMAEYRRLDTFLQDSGYTDIRAQVLADYLSRAAFNQLCQYTDSVTGFTMAQRAKGLRALYGDPQARTLLRDMLRRQPATPQNLLCRLWAATGWSGCILLPLRGKMALAGGKKAAPDAAAKEG